MIRLVYAVLSRLPLRALHAIGGALGWVVFGVSPTYRARLRANVPSTLPQREQVLRRAVAEGGKQMLELAWVWTRSGQQIRARTQVEDAEGLYALLGQDRAIVMMTPHLGCFEVIAQHHAASPIGRDRPMLALYRVPRKAALRPLMEQGRTQKGLRLAPADLHGVRLMLRALRDRQIVGLLPDQVPSRGEGVWAPFFGRPAFTMTLPARLARAHDAIVVLLFAQRLAHGAGYRIYWERLPEPLSGEPLVDATRINQAMERLILRCPEQYLWSYNRYKTPAGVPAPAPEAGT